MLARAGLGSRREREETIQPARAGQSKGLLPKEAKAPVPHPEARACFFPWAASHRARGAGLSAERFPRSKPSTRTSSSRSGQWTPWPAPAISKFTASQAWREPDGDAHS